MALYVSIWQLLLWAFVGSSLDLRGLVLFVSYLSHGHDFGFYFFSFVGGLRGAEPSSLLGGHSFFCFGSLLQRRRTFSDFDGLTSPEGGKGSYIAFFDIASRLAPL